MSRDRDFWVGLDWGSEAHQVCVIDRDRQVVLEKSVGHSGRAILELGNELLQLAGGDPSRVAAAIETPHGALVQMLLERQVAVFSINPKQLDRFRDRHTVAGAKDDRRDAFVLAVSLQTDEPSFRRLELSDPELLELRELVRMREDLLGHFNADANRLRDQLQRYYPQILKLGSVYNDRWLWDLVERVPSPATASRVKRSPIEKILRSNRIRKWEATEVLEIVRSEALPVAPGVVRASVKHVKQLIRRLRVLDEQLRECEAGIKKILKDLQEDEEGENEHRDAAILLSFPGLGTITGATMLAEGAVLLSGRDYHDLRSLSGVAPVTRRSGKSRQVVRRLACNPMLRDAVYNWSLKAVRYSPRAHAHYHRLRARGHSHGRALRGVGDRLVGLLTKLLERRELFDAAQWETA